MNDITVYVLLEFLYNRFAVTSLFCAFGSFIREVFRSTKSKESKMLDIKKIATSTVFSTFLMCACAEYIDLPFSVYAIASIICGMWGLVIINLVLNGKFISKLFINISKKVTDPIVKSAVETASEVMEQQNNENPKDNKE
jgi:hypothetical protein